ncbi:Uncharacterised protein [Legionella pneumophila]|nr:Uncharacterised protein [Legionella pneumophila]
MATDEEDGSQVNLRSFYFCIYLPTYGRGSDYGSL